MSIKYSAECLEHSNTKQQELFGFVFKSWGQRQERRKVLLAECKCLNPFKVFLPWKFSQIAWAEPVFEYSSAVCIHLMPPPFPTSQRSPQLQRLTLRHWLTVNALAYLGSFVSKSSPRSQRSAFQAALGASGITVVRLTRHCALCSGFELAHLTFTTTSQSRL